MVCSSLSPSPFFYFWVTTFFLLLNLSITHCIKWLRKFNLRKHFKNTSTRPKTLTLKFNLRKFIFSSYKDDDEIEKQLHHIFLGELCKTKKVNCSMKKKEKVSINIHEKFDKWVWLWVRWWWWCNLRIWLYMVFDEIEMIEFLKGKKLAFFYEGY